MDNMKKASPMELYSYTAYDQEGNCDCGVVIASSIDDAKEHLWKAGYNLQTTGIIKLNPAVALHKISSHHVSKDLSRKPIWKWIEHPGSYRWKSGIVRAQDEGEAKLVLQTNKVNLQKITELTQLSDEQDFCKLSEYLE